MSNKKQSSVEWLEFQINLGLSDIGLISAFKKAKAMHEQEIIKSNRDGVDMVIDKKPYVTGDEYYNETYGGNNERMV